MKNMLSVLSVFCFLCSLTLLSCVTYTEGFSDGTVTADFPELRRGVPAENGKEVFVILQIENLSGFDFPAYGTLVRRYLQTGLVQTGLVRVVDRDNVDEIIREGKFQLSGMTDNDSVIMIGEMLNARYAITGSILEYSSKCVQKGVSAGLISPGAMGITGANVGVNEKNGKVCVSLELNIIDLQTGQIVESYIGSSEYQSRSYSTDMQSFNTTMMALSNGSMLKIDSDLLTKFDETIVGKTTRKAVINGLKDFSNNRS